MDVSALYTKIFPKTRKLKLYKLPQKIYINITVITSFLTLILILDNFIFNGIQVIFNEVTTSVKNTAILVGPTHTVTLILATTHARSKINNDFICSFPHCAIKGRV